jgi:hypothetical protein
MAGQAPLLRTTWAWATTLVIGFLSCALTSLTRGPLVRAVYVVQVSGVVTLRRMSLGCLVRVHLVRVLQMWLLVGWVLCQRCLVVLVVMALSCMMVVTYGL